MIVGILKVNKYIINKYVINKNNLSILNFILLLNSFKKSFQNWFGRIFATLHDSFQAIIYFFYLVDYKREKYPQKIGLYRLYILHNIFSEVNPVWSKTVVERHIHVQLPIVGNLETAKNALIAQRFVMAH